MMEPLDEADFRVQTQNMHRFGGVTNVLDCLITMMEAQLIIIRKLRELEETRGKK